MPVRISSFFQKNRPLFFACLFFFIVCFGAITFAIGHRPWEPCTTLGQRDGAWICKRVILKYWDVKNYPALAEANSPHYASLRWVPYRCASHGGAIQKLNKNCLDQIPIHQDDTSPFLWLPSPSAVPFSAPYKDCCSTQENCGSICDIGLCSGESGVPAGLRGCQLNITPADPTLDQIINRSGGSCSSRNARSGTADVACSADGDITRCQFNYQPTQDATWQPNESQLFFPQRMIEESKTRAVSVKALVYLHGFQPTATGNPPERSGYTTKLRTVLQEHADQHIVIFAPHNRGSARNAYMAQFQLRTFFQTALEALRKAFTDARGRGTALSLDEVVVSGHSAATCGYAAPKGDKILTQARVATLGGARVAGVVAFDGCLGYPAEGSNPAGATLANVALDSQPVLLVPETGSGGMGAGTRQAQLFQAFFPGAPTAWPSRGCPNYVNASDATCYWSSRTPTLVSIATSGKGHNGNVMCGLRYLFRMFFVRGGSGTVTCTPEN